MRAILTLAVLVCASSIEASAADIVGQASVIDGDTLEIHGTRIRLDGIDAPESAQLCRDAANKPYRCGQRAALALSEWVGQRVVTCRQSGNGHSYDRIVATCSVNGADMAAWLVSQGHALDWPRYSHGRYLTHQRDAVAAQRGMWSGNFVNPWDYRACMRAGGGHIATCSEAR